MEEFYIYKQIFCKKRSFARIAVKSISKHRVLLMNMGYVDQLHAWNTLSTHDDQNLHGRKSTQPGLIYLKCKHAFRWKHEYSVVN